MFQATLLYSRKCIISTKVRARESHWTSAELASHLITNMPHEPNHESPPATNGWFIHSRRWVKQPLTPPSRRHPSQMKPGSLVKIVEVRQRNWDPSVAYQDHVPEFNIDVRGPLLKLERLEQAIAGLLQPGHCCWGVLCVLQPTIQVVACGTLNSGQRQCLRTTRGPCPSPGGPSSSIREWHVVQNESKRNQGTKVLMETVPSSEGAAPARAEMLASKTLNELPALVPTVPLFRSAAEAGVGYYLRGSALLCQLQR